MTEKQRVRQRLYMREWRKTNPEGREKQLALRRKWGKENIERRKELRREWKKRNREKDNAHASVRWAIKTGKLIRPDKCSECSAGGRIEAHHEDYSKRLEVKWLCVPCHNSLRRRF